MKSSLNKDKRFISCFIIYILFSVHYFWTFDISFGFSCNGKCFLVSKAWLVTLWINKICPVMVHKQTKLMFLKHMIFFKEYVREGSLANCVKYCLPDKGTKTKVQMYINLSLILVVYGTRFNGILISANEYNFDCSLRTSNLFFI